MTLSIESRTQTADFDLDEIKLVVILVEDEVTGFGPEYDQRNYGNDDPDHPYYQQGNYIEGFVHTNVIREVLTDFSGDLVDVSEGQPNWTTDIELDNPENFSLVVFATENLSDFPPILNAAKRSFD